MPIHFLCCSFPLIICAPIVLPCQLFSNEISQNQEFENKDIPRPENWGGFIVNPVEYEFWQGGENRLHDRIRYKLVNNLWKIDRLSP